MKMKETFTVPKIRGNVKIAICYASSYKAGMASLAYQKLLSMFYPDDFFVCRFFYENKKTYSPDGFFSLKQADVIIFTISFEPDVVNALQMLINEKIIPQKNKRENALICGGIFPTMNSHFLKNVFDFQFRGEIEGSEDIFLNTLKIKNKNDLVFELNKKFGVTIHNGKTFDSPPFSAIISDNSGFKNAFLIEISRGCRFKCPYCLVGHIYPKFKACSLENLKRYIDLGLRATNKIGLVSALPNSHPEITKIANYILSKGGYPSFSSIRIELLDDDFIKILKKSGQQTLTLALESACPEIRKKIGRKYSNEKVLDIITKSLNYGIKNFKLYFMAGLPGDENAELKITRFCVSVREMLLKFAKKRGIMPGISIDVSLFVPKPGTKWENEKMQGKKFYVNFINKLKKELLPLGIKIKNDDAYTGMLQYVLSRADENGCEEIISVLESGKSIKKLIKRDFERLNGILK